MLQQNKIKFTRAISTQIEQLVNKCIQSDYFWEADNRLKSFIYLPILSIFVFNKSESKPSAPRWAGHGWEKSAFGVCVHCFCVSCWKYDCATRYSHVLFQCTIFKCNRNTCKYFNQSNCIYVFPICIFSSQYFAHLGRNALYSIFIRAKMLNGQWVLFCSTRKHLVFY